MVIGDNSALHVTSHGDVIIGTIKIGDVLRVPSVGPNLIFI